jgi:F0F1-type ATP synthase membrane subunit b/b'
MKSLFTFILLMGVQAFANEHGGGHAAAHGEEGIPQEVMYQAINLVLFLGIIVYYGRATVKNLFQSRYDNFMKLARETEQTRKNLEFQIADIIRRTNTLEQTSQKSLTEAQRDAEKMYNTRIEDAKQSATRMQNEVASQINDDQKKLIEKLRTEALELSVTAAQQQLQSASADEKKKVTGQFTQRVEGATV